MTRVALLLVAIAAGCGDPDVVVDEIRIHVVLQGDCDESAFRAARSISIELWKPLGDPGAPLGHCVLERECVDVVHESLGDVADVQLALSAEGELFVGVPGYEDVQLAIRGSPNDGCDLPPPEQPLFCGFSDPSDIDDPTQNPEAAFTVATTCAAPECESPWPACAPTQ
jgi:hypothetical protein